MKDRGNERPRVMRVFVSSTFRDMAAERDELVKRVFPQLAALCRERGVLWGEVDLRWGITDEQVADGQVLPICLSEIRQCRPYFIGLLGERYGWVPESLDPVVVEREPWLREHANRSVTELEILHGVLNDPAMAQHAFFYFRDPAYAQSRPGFVEGRDPDEERRLGGLEASRRALRRRVHLDALKHRIVDSGLPVREGYPDPQVLADLVLADLTDVINREFPAGSATDPLAREAAAHTAYARSRAAVYLGRRQYVDRLDAHVADSGPPLVVVGEPGSGKSALLANWGLRRQEAADPDELVLRWYVGASPASADWQQMLRWFLGALEQRLQLGITAPSEPAALRAMFASALETACHRLRVILVIDGLNQLEDRDAALELVWLPASLPSNARVVLSALPGATLSELRRRRCETVTVQPLEQGERRQLIAAYLAQYTKSLASRGVDRITASPQSGNPLFLRTLLEELRIAAEHETLGERIAHYTTAADAAELYQMVLDRYEADYERDRPCLVRDVMRLVWAARRGLSHTELRELLGDQNQPLAAGVLAPLTFAAAESLVDRSGLIGFSHQQLRDAVERRYLADPTLRREARLQLAGYFRAQGVGQRPLDELPWQLMQAEAWDQLAEVLSDHDVVVALHAATPHELRGYWVQLQSASPHTLASAYRPIVDDPEWQEVELVTVVAELFERTGDPLRALPLVQELTDRARAAGHRTRYRQLLLRQARLVATVGDRVAAAALEEEAAGVSRSGGTRPLEGSRWRFRELPASTVTFEAGRRMSRVTPNSPSGNSTDGLWTLDGDAVRFSFPRNDNEFVGRLDGDVITGSWISTSGVSTSTIELDRIRDDSIASPDVPVQEAPTGLEAFAASLLDRARRQPDEQGLGYAREAQQVYRSLGIPGSVAVALSVQAELHRLRGERREGLRLLSEAERIYRDIDDPAALRWVLELHATMLRGTVEASAAALRVGQLADHVAQELADVANTGASRAFYEDAIRSEARGELDQALALYRQAQRAARGLLHVRCLHREALLHRRRDELEPARIVATEGLKTATALEFSTMRQVLEDLLTDLSSDTSGVSSGETLTDGTTSGTVSSFVSSSHVPSEGGHSVLAAQGGETFYPEVSVLLREGRSLDAAEMIVSQDYLRIRLQPRTSGEAGFVTARRALADDVVALARVWSADSEPFRKVLITMVEFGFDIFGGGSRFDQGKRMLATGVRAAGDAAFVNSALIPCYIATCERVRPFLNSRALWEGPSGDETGTLLEDAVEETFDKLRGDVPPEHVDWFAQWDAYWQQRD